VQSVVNHPEIRERAIARLRYLPVSNGIEQLRDLAAVRCPALILAAEGDPIHPFEYARQIAQHLPTSRLVTIAPKSAVDDTPHLREVDQMVGEFLSGMSIANPSPLRNA